MSANAPTALDRYRAAKLALDSWDAFRKKYEAGTFSPSWNDGKMALGMDARVSVKTPGNRDHPQEIPGFNEHLRVALKLSMAIHMDEYRLTLVDKLNAAYKDALREAAALLEETPPT